MDIRCRFTEAQVVPGEAPTPAGFQCWVEQPGGPRIAIVCADACLARTTTEAQQCAEGHAGVDSASPPDAPEQA